jgi:hypothetical protein
MKKILPLIIILLFVFKKGHSQTNVYQPFPQDSAVWLYIFSTPNGETWTYYMWIGQTTVNSKTYTQMYQSVGNALGQSVNAVNWNHVGAIRQDIPNEKTYQIDLYGVETDVSISQHLVVGDTMLPISSPPKIIKSIDSTLIYNKYHKVYNSQDSLNLNSQSYIVGVGELSSSNPLGHNGLACFTVNNINDGGPQFCQLASINKFQNPSLLAIYPNPAQNNFTIEVSGKEKQTLQLFDINGRLVLTQTMQNKTNIDVSNFNAGVYNLSLISNEGMTNKKVLIIK